MTEGKVCKDLVNENADLKNLKKQMEDEIKEQRRYSQQLIATQQRASMALYNEEKAKALEDNKRPAPRAKPLQIMEGSILGKKRFDPR
ncbi:hypothetical protein DIPPA_12040 [Diplonema papillatum]|nr:hypothetical protein DIPPA_12040 [Diplonema papillatum]